MLLKDFSAFYDRWIKRIDSFSLDREYDCYDAFFMLFVIYNRLYVAAANDVRDNYSLNNHKPPAIFEKELYQAVDNIYDVLGQEIFAGIISRNHNDIENIILLIDPRAEHYFAICISKKTQKEEKNKNIQLHQALSSGETVRVAPAILTILYRVRCNMFHGTKRFGPIQVVLLAPLIRILRDIVIALKEKYRA